MREGLLRGGGGRQGLPLGVRCATSFIELRDLRVGSGWVTSFTSCSAPSRPDLTRLGGPISSWRIRLRAGLLGRSVAQNCVGGTQEEGSRCAAVFIKLLDLRGRPGCATSSTGCAAFSTLSTSSAWHKECRGAANCRSAEGACPRGRPGRPALAGPPGGTSWRTTLGVWNCVRLL